MLLGYFSPSSGRAYTETMNRKEFTAEVLKKLGMNRDQYNRIRIFNRFQTVAILQLFEIDPTNLTSQLREINEQIRSSTTS